jgi:hypothetical protein
MTAQRQDPAYRSAKEKPRSGGVFLWAGDDAADGIPQAVRSSTTHAAVSIDFLISQQLLEGGFQYEAEEGEPNFYSSQDAVRALAGAGFTAAPSKAKGHRLWVYEKEVHAV